MGDRATVQFASPEGALSACLYSHNGGHEFVMSAMAYARQCVTAALTHKGVSYPLNRCDPDSVMFNFVRSIQPVGVVFTGDYFLCFEYVADLSNHGLTRIVMDVEHRRIEAIHLGDDPERPPAQASRICYQCQ